MNKQDFILRYILARAGVISRGIDIDGVIADALKAWDVASRAANRH